MINPFEKIYSLFKKYGFAYYSLLIALLLIFVFSFSKITLEEDITKMLPDSKKTDLFNELFSKSSFSEKIILNTSLIENNIEKDSLISFTDSLVFDLQKLIPDYIFEIKYSIDDDYIKKVYDYFYNNIPFYLNDNDYKKIEISITRDSILKTIENNYKTLITPAGFAFKNFILNDPLHFTPIILKKLQELQLDEDFEIYNKRIFSKNNRNLIFHIIPKFKVGNTKQNNTLFNKVDSIINVHSKKLNTEYFGSSAVSVSNANQIKSDIILTIIIAIVLLIIILFLFYKKPLVLVLIFIPIIFGAGVSLSIFYFFIGSISSITLGIGAVLIGISIDYSIHLITHYKETGSIKETLNKVTFPIMIGCATTSLAFLGLMFLDSNLLKELGLFASISVFFSAIFTLSFLPYILSKFDFSNLKAKTTFENYLSKISNFKTHRHKIILIILSIILVYSIFKFRDVKFEDDMNKLSYVSEKLINAERNLDSINNYKLKSIYILSVGKNINEAIKSNNETIKTIDSLNNIGIIKKVHNIYNFLLSDSLINVKANNWNNFWSEERKHKTISLIDSISEVYKFKKSAFSTFYNLLNKKFSDADFKGDTTFNDIVINDYIIDSENNKSIISICKIENNKKNLIYNTFKNHENVVILDKQFITSSLIESLKKDFSFLVYLTMIIVFLILTISFGRIELGIISFIPILVCWFITLGLMATFDIKFNIINIIITTFIFGLGIDYSIFITKGLINKYKYNSQEISSFRISIFLSFITTIIGVGVLIFASHPALKSISLVSIIGLTSTIITSYTIIPLLFNWLVYSKREKRNPPITFMNILYSIIALSIFFVGSVILTFFIILPILGKKAKIVYHYILMFFSKFIIYIMFNVKKKIINPQKYKIKKPCLIIANHQSHIDIPLLLMLNPKLIILTNDWVQNNPFYGIIVKFAEFYPVSKGYEGSIETLSEKVKDGYSIVVFPEGTRSQDNKIKRFHKGAFYIAEKLNLDILPLIIHGTGDCMTKGEPFLKSGKIFLKYLPIIKFNDLSFGETYQEKTKNICKYYRKEFYNLVSEYDTLDLLRNKLVSNYIYKSPVLEWYLKVKIKLEKNYEVFLYNIPSNYSVTDLGCGYGFLCYMLHMINPNRQITGIDYDEEKICVANNIPLKKVNINFYCSDISTFNINISDCFIISDVLHYLPFEKQHIVINNCLNNLSRNGILIIRDADTSLEKRHSRTLLTEFFSTKFIGFNKTYDTSKNLFFFNAERLNEIIDKNQYSIKIIDNSKFTSNIIYIIKKI